MNANTDLCQLVAAASDLCRKPWRHGVRFKSVEDHLLDQLTNRLDCCLVVETRDELGQRLCSEDLEIEIYQSGDQLNLTLARPDEGPILWHGSHPVWMDATTGESCTRPQDGLTLESLARRLRSLLQADP